MDVSEYTPYATTKIKGDLIYLIESRHRGQHNAAFGAKLIAEMWGEEAASNKTYNNRYHRSLRAMIEEAVHEGALICSDSTHGYWYADSLQDGMPAAESNLDRANKMRKNAETLIGNLMRTYGRLF